MKIGFHASHEQFSPHHLLELAQRAEQNGFEAILSSDHFHPWSSRQGESGFAWSWLVAAMQATNLEFGIVNAPGQRYHPAIIAQAVATLDEMFPKRFWYCAGSGQALNENITGEKWPKKQTRNKRLEESIRLMRKLWTEDTYISHDGIIQVEQAKLFTKPTHLPTVFGAALTEKTASWLSEWADGLITISRPVDKLKKLITAFGKGGGRDKPMILKVQISYDSSTAKALEGAWKQWRNTIFPSKLISEITSPEQFDVLGSNVKMEEMKTHLIIGNKAEIFIEKIIEFSRLGFDKIIIHNVNKDQEGFIDFFGNHVLPSLQQEIKANYE